MKTCADCGEPIYPMEASYTRYDPEAYYHSACGDPFGIKAKDAEIVRLRIGQAVIAKQVGFYKPETPDFEFVRVPLGILRRALRCDPPPYPDEALEEQK